MKIRDWYRKLPKSVEQRAMGNVVSQGNCHLLSTDAESLEQAIIIGFNMEQANEGPLYWAYAINEVRRLPSSYAGYSKHRERVVFLSGALLGFWITVISVVTYMLLRL